MLKKNTFQLALTAFLLFTSASVFTGCSSKSVNESDPKSMYEDADQDIGNDRYLLALDKLRVIKSKFSYSTYGALAQLRIADVYFLQESFPEAASAYETFVELYPKNLKAAYALFRAGESYFKDIPANTARDLRSADSTISTFNQYLKKFPGGEYTKQAIDMKTQAYNKLAEKEYQVGEFYVRREKPDSAKIRFQKIIDQFPDSSWAPKAKEALDKLPSH